MSPEGWTELMARVQKPPKTSCPTKGCEISGVKSETKPHCALPACLWFVCYVCERTIWLSPKFDFGPLGRKIVRWNIRRQVQRPRSEPA